VAKLPVLRDSGAAKEQKLTLKPAFRVLFWISPSIILLGLFVWGCKMKNLNREERKERVVTFLGRREVDFLDKVGKDALFSTGLKLSRAKLISWLVDFARELDINGENLRSERDFEERIKGGAR
jgi:hypothetical protein